MKPYGHSRDHADFCTCCNSLRLSRSRERDEAHREIEEDTQPVRPMAMFPGPVYCAVMFVHDLIEANS